MTKNVLPITELDISIQQDRIIKSPIRVNNLNNLGINQEAFIKFFSPLFESLPWDPYDARRLRVAFLKKIFPHAAEEINQSFAAYFTGKQPIEVFQTWINQLDAEQKKQFDAIQPWRRRSISQFHIEEKNGNISIAREPVKQFEQNLDSSDFRSLPRIFQEAPAAHVENEYFNQLLGATLRLVQNVSFPLKPVSAIRMSAHFMSVKSTTENPGDNSPEGAHEDGADFIISALVINRFNIEGGETQIIEALPNTGKKEIIFKHILNAGEFVFQADTGEEKTYGNDLWHHVTPFYVVDKNEGDGWRDIIGFDINIVA